MRNVTAAIISLVILMVAACLASATDYYVNVNTGSNLNSGSSPDAAWKTITWALAVGIGTQEDQCVIHIAPGRYAPYGEIFPLSPPSYTSLVGTAPEEVVIDAEGSERVFYIQALRVVLSGLTITGGYSEDWGGGISAYPDDLRIDNCVVRGSQSWCGGGVFMAFTRRGFAELNDCIISDNCARGGGAGIFMTYMDITCVNETMTSLSDAGQVKITRCLISSNLGSEGIYVADTSLELVDSVVADNVSEARPGGLLVGWLYAGVLNLDAQNCLFVSNSNTTGRGGAASVCLWTGGLGARFSECTFVGNAARDGAPALQVKIYQDYSLDAVEVTDCIFRDGGDEIWEEKAGLVRVNNSCVEGGWQGAGRRNFDADPLFVSGPHSDYYLSQTAAGQQEGSPCVDAGSMTALEAGMSLKGTRTDGFPDTGIVDLGFHYPVAPIPPEVRISTPCDAYSHGDTLQIMFTASNPNPYPYPVDVYTAVITTGGVIWMYFDAWGTMYYPWFTSLELPADFTFGPTTLLTIALPSARPPISDPGTYWVAAAFAHVGTTTFIGQPSLSQFTVGG